MLARDWDDIGTEKNEFGMSLGKDGFAQERQKAALVYKGYNWAL